VALPIEIFFFEEKGGARAQALTWKIFFKKARTQYKRNRKIEEFKRQRKKQKR
jgi:hypothetical protein